MPFYADLHIHSKYSRATSRDCDLEHLAWWAQRKGITVVGTGDFTHPAWWQEIQDKLIPAEPGLYRLRPEIEREVASTLPPACRRGMRFMLEVEISTIYKAGDKTRKVHHLIYAAELATAGRFRDRLGSIGNIRSDGRPILGLDSRHLLEITLESGPDAYLVPAHIWTPWFAALGSKSGFDSIDDCYGDLSSHIFAVETGLSSDPPMNWRVSHLDRFTLVSSSDAHSPPMLGREASVFDTDLDYHAMRRALETREGFGGTMEFFPEEGKYHLDGHRTCGIRLDPEETRNHGGRCPSCGKPVTVGVLHRVETLADRPLGGQPSLTSPFRSIVPLPEIAAEIHGVGPKTKTVARTLDTLAQRLGPELEVLDRMPIEDVARQSHPLIAEAIARLRRGEVRADGGFDGEYGRVRLFEPDEIAKQMTLFAFAPLPEPVLAPTRVEPPATMAEGAAEPPVEAANPTPDPVDATGFLAALDPDQRAAARVVDRALLVVAGPGTGKTRTLTHRIAHLIESGVPAAACLAITFTRRAAEEMRERLDSLLETRSDGLTVTTFHGLGLTMLREQHEALGVPETLRVADERTCAEVVAETFGLGRGPAARRLEAMRARRLGRATSAESGGDERGELDRWIDAYRKTLAEQGFVDFDDLLALPAALLETDLAVRDAYRRRWPHVSVDEYQDIDAAQYRLLRGLVPSDGPLAAIGDPDQSIYRFRGAEVGFFLRFENDFPGAHNVLLGRNYRSSRTVVEAAAAAIAPGTLVPERRMAAASPGSGPKLVRFTAEDPRHEAAFVVARIEALLGGTSHYALDSGWVDSRAGRKATLSTTSPSSSEPAPRRRPSPKPSPRLACRFSSAATSG